MPRLTAIAPSRGLIVISTIVVALVLLLASSVQATTVGVSPGDPLGSGLDTAEYSVRAGDSLWAIADDHTPRGRDVRNTIEAIKDLNGLTSSVIHPGQVLEIPLTGE